MSVASNCAQDTKYILTDQHWYILLLVMEELDHGRTTCSDSTNFGSRCFHSCNLGYELRGSAARNVLICANLLQLSSEFTGHI